MSKYGPNHKNKNIPDWSRILVRQREVQRCARCGVAAGAGSGQWHHRRSRRIVLLHRHCPCNGVYLCQTCHRWAHSNPDHARDLGLILSAEETAPFEIPLRTFWGWRYHDCAGQYEYVTRDPDPLVTALNLRKGTDPE